MEEHKSYQAAMEICVSKSLEALGNLPPRISGPLPGNIQEHCGPARLGRGN